MCLGQKWSWGAEGDKTRVSRAVKTVSNHLWREDLGHPHIPFPNTQAGIWGPELEGVGEGGGKRDPCKPDVSSIVLQSQVQLGEGGSLASLASSWIFTTRQQAPCPTRGLKPAGFPPAARSPFHFLPCNGKLHFSRICCHKDTEKPSQTDQIRELWDSPPVTPMLVEEQFESIFHTVAPKPWDSGSQPLFSLVQAHRGSQLAGQTSPRKGRAGPDSLFCTCFHQQSS